MGRLPLRENCENMYQHLLLRFRLILWSDQIDIIKYID